MGKTVMSLQAFGQDTVRDMLCNPYYLGMIRCRGIIERPKDVSFRSTLPQVSEGQAVDKEVEDAVRRYPRRRLMYLRDAAIVKLVLYAGLRVGEINSCA